MTDEAPIACSLGAAELERRLAAIAALGSEALIEHDRAGGRHLLRFRPDAQTRKSLEAIVAAEAKCCPFLELSLNEEEGALALSIDAPAEGRATADGLAAAFSGAQSAG